MTWAIIESKWAAMTLRVRGDWPASLSLPMAVREADEPVAAPVTEARSPVADHDRFTPGS